MTTDSIGRRRCLYAVVACLEGDRSDLTPAEVLRNVSRLAGWSFATAQNARPGTFLVDAGDGKGERFMRREQLIPFLLTNWLPAAKAELAKETTTP